MFAQFFFKYSQYILPELPELQGISYVLILKQIFCSPFFLFASPTVPEFHNIPHIYLFKVFAKILGSLAETVLI